MKKIVVCIDVIVVIFFVDFGIYGKGGNWCRYNGILFLNLI